MPTLTPEILDAIQNNNSGMSSLELAWNQIDEKGAETLAARLKHNRTLQSIDLGENKIDDEGATAIAASLKDNQVLTTLDLSNNNIGDQGARAILDCLSQNRTLIIIHLWDNPISNDLLEQIKLLLERNAQKKETSLLAAKPSSSLPVIMVPAEAAPHHTSSTAAAAPRSRDASPSKSKHKKSKSPEENFHAGEKYLKKHELKKAKKYFERAAKENYPGVKEKLAEIKNLLSQSPGASPHPPHHEKVTPAESPAVSSSPAALPGHAARSKSDLIVDDAGMIKVSVAIPHSELTRGKELGKGAYGVVYEGIYYHKPAAIKELLNQDLKAEVLEEFKREVSIMANTRSPFIVQLYGACFEKPYSLVMEFYPNGSLYKLLASNHPISWSKRYQIGIDVGCGLEFLHKRHIVHGDMKSLNVLLRDDFSAVISDFGLAKLKQSDESKTSTVIGSPIGGSLRWMAPELFEEEGAKSTPVTDVFSYGVILWELGARRIPFDKSRNEAVPFRITKGDREEPTADTPPSMARLIKLCWHQNKKERPAMEQAVKVLIDNKKEIETVVSNASQAAPPSQSSTPGASGTNNNGASQVGSGYQPNLRSFNP